MKNFKIAMILVAAVAMFCSCGDPEAPTVTLNGDVTTFNLASAEQPVVLTVDAKAPKGLENLYGNVWGYYANDTTPQFISELKIGDDFTVGTDAYNGTINYTLKKESVNAYEKVLFQVVAVTKKDVEAAGNFYVTIEQPAVTEANFTWVKHGNTTEDLSAYGLNWNRNVKATKVEILPVTNAKLYVLESTDYANTDVNFLNGKQTAEKYYNVRADQSGTYDDVIASVYNGKTYLFHVTKGEILPYNETTNPTGTKVTITGTVKTFETVPTQTTSK